MFSSKSISVLGSFALTGLSLALPATAATQRTCLLIIADSTISFAGQMSSSPAYEAAEKYKDEWAQTMMARADALASPELAADLKDRFPFMIRYADFSEEVTPRTEWVEIQNAKDLAAFAAYLSKLPRIMRGRTHTFKALTWARTEVKNCPYSAVLSPAYVINAETDGTPSDIRRAETLVKGIYTNTILQAFMQDASNDGITINALGIGYTSGDRPSMDRVVDLGQVMRDNFRTPDGAAFIVKTPDDFSDTYRRKLRQDMVINPSGPYQWPVFAGLQPH